MRSTRILDRVSNINISNALSNLFGAISTSSMAAAADTKPAQANHANEYHQKTGVVMHQTKRAASDADIQKNIDACVNSNKPQPDIFAALVHEQAPSQVQAAAYTDKLIRQGRIEELDVLVGSGAVSREAVTAKLLDTNSSSVFLSALEHKSRLRNLGLFAPESPVIIVEANNKRALEEASVRADGKRIIAVDSTEAYAPTHRVIHTSQFSQQLAHKPSVASNTSMMGLYGMNSRNDRLSDNSFNDNLDDRTSFKHV